MDGKCLETKGEGSAVMVQVVVGACTGKPNQHFVSKPSSGKVKVAYTVEQGGLCVDQGLVGQA